MTGFEGKRFDDLVPNWFFVHSSRALRAAIAVAASLFVGVAMALAEHPEDLRLAPLLAIVLVGVAATAGPQGSVVAGLAIATEYWWFATPPGESLGVTMPSGAIAVASMYGLATVLALLTLRIEHVVVDVRELDDVRRAQAQVETDLRRRAERTVAQTEAVIELGSALANAHTVAEVAHTALRTLDLPTRPSSAVVAIVAGDHLQVLASFGAAPELIEQLERVALATSPWLGAVLAGEPAYVEDRDAFADRYPDALVLRMYGSGSWLVLPFRSHDTVGLLSVHYVERQVLRAFSMYFSLVGELLGSSLERGRAEEQRRHQHHELETAFAERDRIARTLSTSLLPPTLPRLRGFQASGWLVPASNDQLAGDFYDLFVVADGGWVAVLGDVCGKGAEAAAVTSLARYAVRSAALDNPDPADVVRVANQALTADPSDLFCTVAIVRSVAAGEEVEVTLAGHMQVRQVRDATVCRLGSFGTALGLATEPALVSRCAMPRGAMVVLFSDGLVETDPAFREDDFDEFLARSAATTADELSCEIRALVGGLRSVHPDDVAVLVIQRT